MEWGNSDDNSQELSDELSGDELSGSEASLIGQPDEDADQGPAVQVFLDPHVQAKSSEHQIGSYRLCELMEVDATGEKWLARTNSEDPVALHVLSNRVFRDGEEEDVFVRRVLQACRVQIPHVAAVKEIGRANGSIYIVTELVRGIGLQDWLVEESPDEESVCELIARLAELVHSLHEAGIVHGNLSCSSIRLVPEANGTVLPYSIKLVDLGFRFVSATDLTGKVFRAPELFENRADLSSDVYSLGAILYLLLTGSLPFHASSELVEEQIRSVRPQPPSHHRSEVHPDLDRISLKALAKNPASRFKSAADLSRAIRGSLLGQPLGRLEPSRWLRGWGWLKRHPGWGTSAVITVLLLCAGCIRWLWVENELSAILTPPVAAEPPGILPGAVGPSKTAPTIPSVSPQVVQQAYGPGLTQVSSTGLGLPISWSAVSSLGAARFVAGQAASDVEDSSGSIALEATPVVSGSWIPGPDLFQRPLAGMTQGLRSAVLAVDPRPRLADRLNDAGTFYLLRGQHELAIGLHWSAFHFSSMLDSETPENHARIARIAYNLGVSLQRGSKSELAYAKFQVAERIWRGQAQVRDDSNTATGLAQTLNNLGCLEFEAGNLPSARAYFEQAYRLRLQAFDDHWTSVNGLSQSCSNLAVVASINNDRTQARRMFGRAIELRSELVDREPDNYIVHGDLASTLDRFGVVLMGTRRVDEAGELFRRAWKHYELANAIASNAATRYQPSDLCREANER